MEEKGINKFGLPTFKIVNQFFPDCILNNRQQNIVFMLLVI